MLSVLGVAIPVFAFAGYLRQRARSQGGDGGKLMWAVAIGATLAAPGVIFPLISVYEATQ